jgi:hypothetical protein
MTQIIPDASAYAARKPSSLLTAAVWSLSLASLVAAGIVATGLVIMASSLDPTDVITSGIEAWTEALEACAGFVALVCVSAVALRLWHSRRFAAVGFTLAVAQALITGWACVMIFRDYV